MSRSTEIKAAIRPETRLVVMTHGSNVLGTLQNVRPVAEYCAANDIFLIVDGAQTAGQIPVNLSAIAAGAFVFTGHKALFGIPGIGGFYLDDPDAIATVRQGGTGTDSRLLSHPQEMPQKFEAGTPNYPGIAALLAGIRFIEREGQDASLPERPGSHLPLHPGDRPGSGYHPLYPGSRSPAGLLQLPGSGQ